MTNDPLPALRDEVASALAHQERAVEADGGRPSAQERHGLIEQLIGEALQHHAEQRLGAGEQPLSTQEEDRLKRAVRNDLLGLGERFEALIADDSVENINANGADIVWVTYVDGHKEQVDPIADSDDELIELIRTAAARVGITERRFDTGCPRLRLQLPDGSRLFATMAVARRPTVSIRKHHFDRMFLSDLVDNETIDKPLAAFLSSAVVARKNIVVCGGADAGKTTLLRALANEIPEHERIITIEDSFELALDRFPELHPDVVTLESREPNIEGQGEITQAELVRWSLRMDPDRVIVGEARGDETVAMLHAMTLGNDGSMCSVHADSSRGAFSKLALYAREASEHMPMEVAAFLIAQAVDFVVFIGRDLVPSQGVRRRYVASVREVVGSEDIQVTSNEVFCPGPEGLAVPDAPLRDETMDELVRVGFDPALLDHGGDRR